MSFKNIIKTIKGGRVETEQGKLKRKADLQRWQIAQDSEKEYWNEFTTEFLLKRSGDRYPKKAERLLREWSEFIKINKNTKILQIGCGPEDVINYFKTGKKYSIDPLAKFYKQKFRLDYKSSHLTEGRGEEIPFPDEYFDVVVIINVLDHTQLPDKVFSEIKKVLKKNGILHFENYIYQKRFIQLAKIKGKIKEIFKREMFNIHHPYTFTLEDVRTLVLNEFSILKESVGKDIGFHENIKELSESVKKEKRFSTRILAKFGLLGLINYTCICRRKNGI